MAALTLLVAGLALGGCAQQPKQVTVAHGREYFPSSVYGNASRRVIADGQPVPKGGGQYLVGKPYTIAGRTYYPSESRATQVGLASWYGDAFHGRLTANGEIYDRDSLTAASPTLPLPSYVRVTNLRNNYSMVVRVNDRGPYASNRIMDVSRRVAEALDFKRTGTTNLKVQYVGRASLAGSDDARLYATLRNGTPAPWREEPTMVADVPPTRRVAVAAVASDLPDETLQRRPALDPAPMPRRRFAEVAERGPPEDDAAPMVASRPTRHDRRFAMAERPPFEPSPRMRPGFEDAPKPQVRHGFTATRQNAHPFAEPPIRTAASGRGLAVPPTRPMDLGTIPGAGVPIHAARHPSQRWREARARDD